MTGLEDVEFALTLHRPWHALVLLGSKNIENRPWKPDKRILGKRIAIHAGAKFDEPGWKRARDIMLALGENTTEDHLWELANVQGAIVGTALVTGWVQRSASGVGFMSHPNLTKHFESPWFFGPYGWILEDRRVLERPVFVKGAQKCWAIPEEARR